MEGEFGHYHHGKVLSIIVYHLYDLMLSYIQGTYFQNNIISGSLQYKGH